MPSTRILLVVATLVLTCASCTQADDPPSTAPSPSSTSSSPTAPTSSTTPSVPSYLKKYPRREREAYSDALSDYSAYRRTAARFESQATAPNAAMRFYKAYTADWLSYWALRNQMAGAGIRVIGVPEVNWSRPALVRLTANGGGTVHLRLCLDARNVKVTQRGEPVPQNKTPTISRVSMSRLPDDIRWKFLMAKAGAPC